MHRWTRRQCVTAPLLGLPGLLLGCGGGSTPPVGSEGTSGRLVLEIAWPAPSRLIPEATTSIRIRILADGLELARQEVARPSGATTSQVTFNNLPARSVIVSSEALARSSPILVYTVASGEAPVTVTAGQSTSLSLTMGTTITRIDLYPNNFSDLVSRFSTTIRYAARDSANRYVLTTNSQIVFESSNTSVATVSPDMQVKYLSAGTTTLTLRDKESNVSSSTQLTLLSAPPVPGVNLVVDTPAHAFQLYDPATDATFSVRAVAGGGCEFVRVNLNTGAITAVAGLSDLVNYMTLSPKRGRIYFISRNNASTQWRMGYLTIATSTITILPTPTNNPFKYVYPLDNTDETLVVFRSANSDVAVYEPTTQTIRPNTFTAVFPLLYPTERPDQLLMRQYLDGYWFTRLEISASGVFPQDIQLPAYGTSGNIANDSGKLIYANNQYYSSSGARYDVQTYSYTKSFLLNIYYGATANGFCMNSDASYGYFLNPEDNNNTAWSIYEYDLNTLKMIKRKEIFGTFGSSTTADNFLTWCGGRRVIAGAYNRKQLAIVDFSVP